MDQRHGWRLAMSTLSFAVAAVGLVACGPGGPGYGSAPPGNSTASTTSVISTGSGSVGTYLTDGQGRTLYLFEADSAGTSTCSGACARVWQPVIVDATPRASAGVTAADLGTINRPGGGLQASYDGHPLYYYVKDSGAGQTTGQGSNEFGARWWLVAPSGSPITSSAPSTGGGNGGYGGY